MVEEESVEFFKAVSVGEGNRNLLMKPAARLRNIAKTLHKYQIQRRRAWVI